MILFTVLMLTCYFHFKKNKKKDFSCQFDQSCSEKVCENMD
jgi:hypothetical protein